MEMHGRCTGHLPGELSKDFFVFTPGELPVFSRSSLGERYQKSWKADSIICD